MRKASFFVLTCLASFLGCGGDDNATTGGSAGMGGNGGTNSGGAGSTAGSIGNGGSTLGAAGSGTGGSAAGEGGSSGAGGTAVEAGANDVGTSHDAVFDASALETSSDVSALDAPGPCFQRMCGDLCNSCPPQAPLCPGAIAHCNKQGMCEIGSSVSCD